MAPLNGVKLEVGQCLSRELTDTKVACICEVLLRENNILKLEQFLQSLPVDWPFLSTSENHGEPSPAEQSILKAVCFVAFENSNYVTVLHILRHIQFSTWHQPLLQQLWYQTHYAQTERRRGKKLGAVDKYRLRRRHPLPRTIWDGEETVYCFKQSVRHILQQYFLENKYPNPEEKFTLAKATGLSCTQARIRQCTKKYTKRKNIQGSQVTTIALMRRKAVRAYSDPASTYE
ncbi:homeobox protein SIX4 [Clonorchis sinensis]|uniref:Homeobox protein SIX4 n=1 Tax=Clonorchis sinensis TaxID=79923 RepID=H2KR51_CLOSI|nr:homeobox protein SIX4 [Clonorchis sinensis]